MSSKPTKTEIANRLKELRFAHGQMTQQELADRVGVTRQTIIALEASRYVPSLALALRIAATFKSRIEDVFSLSE